MAGKRLTQIARRLRKEPTDAEMRLWSRVRRRQLGVAFTRQFQIGNAVVDLACRRLRLAIELDGGQHADNPADEARTRVIEAHGYRVIRFWNTDVLRNTDGVVQAILQEIALARNEAPELPSPCPLPAVGRGNFCRDSLPNSRPARSAGAPSPLRGRVGVGVLGAGVEARARGALPSGTKKELPK